MRDHKGNSGAGSSLVLQSLLAGRHQSAAVDRNSLELQSLLAGQRQSVAVPALQSWLVARRQSAGPRT